MKSMKYYEINDISWGAAPGYINISPLGLSSWGAAPMSYRTAFR